MKRLFFVSVFVLFLSLPVPGQTTETSSAEDDLALRKLSLISALQSLEAKCNDLNSPLARALARAEIADAAWSLKPEWARKLLREAYLFTFPDEDEQTKLRKKPAGSEARPRTPEQRARDTVQSRILAIARRDKDLVQELAQLGAEHLGAYESHLRNTRLALQALQAGEKETAATYLTQAIRVDPTQITAAFGILELAERDPKLGDTLILQHIELLRSFPLSHTNGSASRAMLALHVLIFHVLKPDSKAPPPGPVVMRAYVSFVLDHLRNLEQREPGSLQRGRGWLLMAWPILQKYAVDLTADFLALEQRSRVPNDNSSLPTLESLRKKEEVEYENRINDALESDQPSELLIDRAIGRNDFSKARKLINKLPDSPLKTQLMERVNAKEALYLLRKQDLPEAKRLAEKLKHAVSILEVYPPLIEKCVSADDQTCSSSLMLQAIKQLKSSDTTPTIPPTGIPSSVFATSREFDPILESMAKLTLAVLPLDDELALRGMEETVFAANVSEIDTAQGRIGFDVTIFRKLAPKNEARAEQAAQSFKDPLRHIVALATIYQWKADELKKAQELKMLRDQKTRK